MMMMNLRPQCVALALLSSLLVATTTSEAVPVGGGEEEITVARDDNDAYDDDNNRMYFDDYDNGIDNDKRGAGLSHALRIRRSDLAHEMRLRSNPFSHALRIKKGGFESFGHALRIRSPFSHSLRIKKMDEDYYYEPLVRRAMMGMNLQHALRVRRSGYYGDPLELKRGASFSHVLRV